MKKILIGSYVVMILPFWIYLSNWGALAYKGAAYNLGRAFIWPVVLFPALGQAIAAIVILGLVAFSVFFMRAR